MHNWDRNRYDEEQRRFIQRRIHLAPLWGQFTLVFGASWGAAWSCSWFLLRFVADAHPWARSLPIRYAIAFLFAYACFLLAIRIWIETVNFVLGDWKMRLLQSTWKQALAGILTLVAVASWLQQQAPQASTFAGAVRAIKLNGRASRTPSP
jgi:hypothetical protein